MMELNFESILQKIVSLSILFSPYILIFYKYLQEHEYSWFYSYGSHFKKKKREKRNDF